MGIMLAATTLLSRSNTISAQSSADKEAEVRPLAIATGSGGHDDEGAGDGSSGGSGRRMMVQISMPPSPARSPLVRSVLLLLLAPAVCLALCVLVTSRYVTLVAVLLVPAAKPLLYLACRGRVPAVVLPLWCWCSSRYYNSSACGSRSASKSSGLEVKSGDGGEASSDDGEDSADSVGFDKAKFDDLVRAALQTHRSIAAQCSLVICFVFAYLQMSGSIGGGGGVNSLHREAYENGRYIVLLERRLGIDVEPALQNAFLPHQWFMNVANQYYGRMHFVVPILSGGWLVATGRDGRGEHRASFCLALVLALLGYWFLPTMPPRLLGPYHDTYLASGGSSNSTAASAGGGDLEVMAPWYGMVDTMRESSSAYDKLHQEYGNPYAAMPSMHTGWAFWSALSVGEEAAAFKQPARRKLWRCVLALHVAAIMFATVVTANHYLLDLAAGIGCVLAGRAAAGTLAALILGPPPKNGGAGAGGASRMAAAASGDDRSSGKSS